MVCTNHTYASQDMFDPDDKISGGQGFIYASSIVVAMRKLKLKEEGRRSFSTSMFKSFFKFSISLFKSLFFKSNFRVVLTFDLSTSSLSKFSFSSSSADKRGLTG